LFIAFADAKSWRQFNRWFVIMKVGDFTWSANGLSRLFVTIAAACAELERDRIRQRITQVKRDQKAREARPIRGVQG
jgi:DNA invertase Pin-like site-specific DNA recombinase